MRTAGFFEIVKLLFNQGERFRVEGNSMLPALKDGDEVYVEKASDFRVGDIVVAQHPFRKTPIIKRITGITGPGKFFLAGDNPAESTDSRSFGEINADSILGKVVCKLR